MTPFDILSVPMLIGGTILVSLSINPGSFFAACFVAALVASILLAPKEK